MPLRTISMRDFIPRSRILSPFQRRRGAVCCQNGCVKCGQCGSVPFRSVLLPAYAFNMDYDESPLIPGATLFPYTRFHIPWLAYLSAPLASDFQLPAEIRSE